MTIGLFFGSFNPIHSGHLIIAQVMLQQARLDKVWFVVSPQNPFKRNQNLLHEFDRLDLVRAAIDDNPAFEATDVEFAMPRPSYTIDTLTYLTQRHPSYRFQLIIGQDNLPSFPKWKNYKQILDQYGLLVYPRPNATPSELSYHPQVRQMEAPMMDISATFIRKSVQKGHSVRYLVPDPVNEIIESRKYFL
jgi:nicotinate-nucleotide adenylyltransferase